MIEGVFVGPPVSVLAAYVIATEPVMARVTIPNTDPTRESVTKSMPLYINSIRKTISNNWFLVEGATGSRHPIEIRISYGMEEWSIKIDNEASTH